MNISHQVDVVVANGTPSAAARGEGAEQELEHADVKPTPKPRRPRAKKDQVQS